MTARYWMVAEDRVIDGPAGVHMVDGFVALKRIQLPTHVMGLESRSLLWVYDRDASPNYEGLLVHLTMALHYDDPDRRHIGSVTIQSRQVEVGGEARIPDAWRCPPGAKPEDLEWSAAAGTPWARIEPAGDGP